MTNVRLLTRRQRYDIKQNSRNALPLSMCCVNFEHDGNLGFLIRSAACFGASAVHVIGSVPTRRQLNPISGSLYDYVKIQQYKNPGHFLDYAKSNNVRLVAAEICEGSRAISSYNFDFSSHVAVVVGNETTGVPVEILKNSDVIHIPMPGPGYCLNTSQAANILLYEATMQYYSQEKKK